LGFVISEEGVKMDPAKVDLVTSWPAPKSAHDVRMFLRLANFYRRFIRDFSKLATPLTRLLKKKNLAKRFIWDRKAQEAFVGLRDAFTTAPILRHFDEFKPVILEADASDLAFGAVVSQYGDDGLLHPVAYHSRKFGPAELNYEIYDKELLTIVDSLEHYRHMFEGLGQQITIYSDHHNLLWFRDESLQARPSPLGQEVIQVRLRHPLPPRDTRGETGCPLTPARLRVRKQDPRTVSCP
jgi:RNase H-like domain found in reverse transcriptase